MNQLSIIQNPVIDKSLLKLRDKDLEMRAFRNHADILISELMEQSIKFELKNTKKTSSDFCIVVILRSAVAMLVPAIRFLPDARVGFAGVKRDERTAIPSEYYWKMPSDISSKIILILDPMLATGGSVIHVIKKLKEQNAKNFRVISVISAPEGASAIANTFPEVKIYTSSIDSHLDTHKFIVPGLGDFGDRYFGTNDMIFQSVNHNKI